MLKIKEYVKAESLEQAYELNQKRTNCILGGMLWLKMSNRNVQKAIDLSGHIWIIHNRSKEINRLNHRNIICHFVDGSIIGSLDSYY